MHTRLLLLLVALAAAISCSDDPESALGPTAFQYTGSQTITVGHPFTGTIFASDAPCTIGDVFGPCRRFRVAPARTGFLRIGLHWSGGINPLELVRLDRSSCCVSSLFTTCQVRSGSIHDFAIVMRSGTTGAFGLISQSFQIITSFDTVAAPGFNCR